MFYVLIVIYIALSLQEATNLKMCLRLTEMYSKVLHSQRIQYHTARIQRNCSVKSVIADSKKLCTFAARPIAH